VVVMISVILLTATLETRRDMPDVLHQELVRV
jgi:hypothetical protein